MNRVRFSLETRWSFTGGFPDPPQLAREITAPDADGQAELDCYREVRDQIKNYIETLPESLGN